MRLVLVRLRDPNNIGAAARAAVNFGFSELVVVAPYPPVWAEVRSAVGADGVLAGARVVGTLGEAVSDMTLVGGTTAGTRRRVRRVVTPEAFFGEAVEAGWDRTAIVFGNEKTGLTRDDLARCHTAVRIPTSAEQPSMNVGQAVAVCCYEAARAQGRVKDEGSVGRRARGESRASIASVDALLALVSDQAARARVGLPDAGERLRRLLLDGRATEGDIGLLRGLLDRTSPPSSRT